MRIVFHVKLCFINIFVLLNTKKCQIVLEDSNCQREFKTKSYNLILISLLLNAMIDVGEEHTVHIAFEDQVHVDLLNSLGLVYLIGGLKCKYINLCLFVSFSAEKPLIA